MEPGDRGTRGNLPPPWPGPLPSRRALAPRSAPQTAREASNGHLAALLFYIVLSIPFWIDFWWIFRPNLVPKIYQNL